MPDTKSYRELAESEQKEFCFELITRMQHYPEFYPFLKELMNEYPSPFDKREDNPTRTIKPEFCETCS